MSFRQPSASTPLRIAFHVMSALTLIVAPAIHAQDQSFWSFLEPGRVVTRCPESSAESRQARTRLERLDRRIEQLEDVDPPAGAIEELYALLQSECFLGNEGSMRFDERPASGAAVTSRECAAKASHGEPSERYHTWRACIEEQRPKSIALPLGHFTAPKDGWMIISGRRGHYGFCDTTRAYDLATGAAFISDSCSALALKRDGSVDRGATDEARVERLAAGSVPVENLREALWMMLFRGETAEVQLKAEYYALPEGFVPQVAVPLEQNDAIGPVWASTSQTSLTWQYVPRSGSGFVGELTWPSSFDAADDHAAFLLDVAEQGFAGGCARQARLPVLGKQEVRRLNDVRTEAIEELRADFVNAAGRWAGLPACRPARR